MLLRIIPAIFFLLPLSLLWGCAGHLSPPRPLAEQLDYTPETARRYRADIEWWKAYHDEQLNRLMETALHNNVDLAQSALSVNRALYEANRLGADLVPAFAGSVGAQVDKNLKTGVSSPLWNAELTVSYEVDLWRRLADTVNAQEWEHKATLEDLAATRLALVNNVADSYFLLAYLNGGSAVIRDSVAYYRQILELAEAKYAAGKVDALEPAQATQSLLEAENNLLDLQRQRKEVEQTLRDLLNLRPDEPLPPAYPNLLEVASPGVELNVPLSVLANRPDLRAAEDRVRGAFKSAQAANKSWYPTITLGAALRSSSDKASTLFDVPFTSGNITVDLPFLQWNTVKWDIKISETDFESAKLNFAQSITTALNEVDAFHFKYMTAKETLDTTRKKYEKDVLISGYYQTRYEQGANELSDWLDALAVKTSSELALLNARYTELQYENALYKAMAGRYSALPVAAATAGDAAPSLEPVLFLQRQRERGEPASRQETKM